MFGFGFWRKVKKNPDLALALFESDPDCIVNGERQRGYQGPFLVADRSGRTHYVQIRGDEIRDVQDRIIRRLEAGPGEILRNVVGRLRQDVEIGFPLEEWEAVLTACILLNDNLPDVPEATPLREAVANVIEEAEDLWDRPQAIYYVKLKQAGWMAIQETLHEIVKESPAESQPYLKATMTIGLELRALNARAHP